MKQKQNFALVKKYFEQLNQLDKTAQRSQLDALKKQNVLDTKQHQLLTEMLHADEKTNLATNIQSLSDNLVEQAVVANSTLKIKQIGPYEIIKSLGEGGMGSVFLAQRNDGQFEQKVAIKLPLAGFNKQMLQRFENERQILAQLTHKNIAHLLDGGTTENQQPYLVMEYVEGLDIDKYCIKNLPKLNKRIELVLQVCQAVAFAHQKLVLHRDLKPGNILVTDNGQVKLLDFGIAKLLDDGADNKTATQIMTRNYASPEQIQGKVIGTQSDLFSLAVIAYELITGFHPFQADDQHQREQNLVSGKITTITKRTQEEPHYPALANLPINKIKGDLENILFKALQAEPEKRYDSVKDFAADLRNFCNNKPVNARKPSFFYKFGKLIQRHKIATIAIVLTLVTLIASSIFSYNKAQEAEKQRQIAIEQKQTAIKEKITAEKQTQKAKEISRIMQNLFKQARPADGASEVLAKDLLDNGIEQLINNKEIDTNNKYNLMVIIFRSYAYLGKIETLNTKMKGIYSQCIKELSKYNINCQNVLIYKAYTQHRLGNDHKAVEFYLQAENIAKNEKPINEDMYFKILTNEFGPLYNTEQYDLAVKKSEQAISMLENSDNSSLLSITIIKSNLVNASLQAGKFNKAKNNLDEIYNNLIKLDLKDSSEMRNYQSKMASYYEHIHQPKLSIPYHKKTILDINKHFKSNTQQLGIELKNLTNALFRAGQLNESLKTAFKTVDFFESYGNGLKFKQIYAHLRIVLIYLMQNKLSKATEQYQKIQALKPDLSSKNRPEQCLYSRIQLFYFITTKNQLDKVKQEMKRYGKCLEIDTSYNRENEIYLNLLNYLFAIQTNNIANQKLYYQQLHNLLNKYPDDYFSLKNYLNVHLHPIRP